MKKRYAKGEEVVFSKRFKSFEPKAVKDILASTGAEKFAPTTASGAAAMAKEEAPAKAAAKGKDTKYDDMSFSAAFRQAMKDKGKGSTFTWRGEEKKLEYAKPPSASSTVAKSNTAAATPAATATSTARATPAKPAPAKPTTAAAPARPTQSQEYTRIAKKAAEDAAAQAKAEGRPTGDKEGVYARFKNLIGMGSSASTRLAENYNRLAKQEAGRAKSIAEYGTKREAEKKAEAAAKAKQRADIIAAGKKPNATPAEKRRSKYYEENPSAMKKGGKVKAKGYASGGSVKSASKRADGCAIRGKTRAR